MSGSSRIKQYADNLTRYWESLPDSNTCFLYFRMKDGNWVPYINNMCKVWKVGDECDVYVAHSKTSGDGYCYVYQKSELDYKVFVDDDKAVSAFEKHTYHTLGGCLITCAKWGNHLTIGLFNSYVTKKLMIDTHQTVYDMDKDRPTRSQTTCYECKMNFDEPLTSSTRCIMRGMPTDRTLWDTYGKEAREPALISIIEQVKQVYEGVVRGGGRQRRGPRVYIGPRGGTYVMVKQRKKYLSIKGGAGANALLLLTEDATAFSDKFIEFLRSDVVEPAAIVQPDLSEFILMYEKGGDGMMARYNYGTVESDICYVDVGMASRALSFASLNVEEQRDLSVSEARATVDRFKSFMSPRQQRVFVHY